MNIMKNKMKTISSIAFVSMFLNCGVSYASNSAIINNESPVLITESNVNNSINENNTVQEEGSLNNTQSYVTESNVNNSISEHNAVQEGGSLNNTQNYTTESNANNSLINKTNEVQGGGSIPDSNTNISLNDRNNVIQGGGSLAKAEGYVENKLFDVVGFFQSIIKSLCYLTFIISTIMILFGVVTDSKSKFKGFLGMAFSIFVYVTVVFAPQIVEYFSSWLAVM